MKVQPVTDLRHVRSIKCLLADSPRDKLLFVMGVKTFLPDHRQWPFRGERGAEADTSSGHG
ncbi:hypothetical protein DesfrDRAFT_3566 [Solidesulfovibrio fructosivorans JJ]]|uniref:Uncharacterized protein n=1 Tax=Solidesulfovibrio fructosivorans JJ] TaxID=596151 RepID=E1K116_SOLFR|nr:hypothetical protein DesfrDRAFT_3566 [Solidesulfovibrio fructosivorans JJ]]